MLRALLYLRLASLWNLGWSRLRRLRQPKYLAGALVALGYFYFFLFRHAGAGMRAPGGSLLAQLPPDTTALVLGLGGLALLTVVFGMWLLPSDRPGLRFSEAEIAFLFAAPITRRGLLHYKLVSTLFASLLQTVFFAAIFNGRALLTGRGGYLLVSWWLLLSFISLHYLGASLTIAKLAERGVHARLRRWALLGVVVVVVAVLGGWIWVTLPSLLLSASVATWGQTALSTGALRWLTWPGQLLVRPFVARGAGEFVFALGPALAVLALHYLWVIRTNVAFEEASIASAERRASRLAELRRNGGFSTGPAQSAGRAPPWDLRRTPGPEFAFLWKNLLSTRRWLTPRTWLVVAGALVAVSVVLQRTLGPDYWKAGSVLTAAGLMAALAALVYGPLLTRLDLRQDLINADILKMYPLPGWRIVLGELLAPTLILTGIVWLGVLAWYLGLHGHHPPALSVAWFSPGMRVIWCGCAAGLTPLILGIELLIPNAAPVLLPGWFQTLRTPGGGIDLMGQRLIFGFGQLVVVALALGSAVAVAAALHLIVRGGVVVLAVLRHADAASPAPLTTLLLWTAVVGLVLLGELVLGVRAIGRRFERMDVSEGRT